MLTPKQESFCIEYAKTGNATEAYRRAYSVKSDGTARANASRLLANSSVKARLAELQAEITNKRIMDAVEIKERLTAIARREVVDTVTLPNGEQVQKSPSIRDTLRALETLAKISGLFVTKQELDVKGITPIVIHDDI